MPDPASVSVLIGRTFEDLSDEAELGDGTLSREKVDILYLRRGIGPDHAAGIERKLRSLGIEIVEERPEPPPPAKAPEGSATALDYLLWSTRGYRLLTADEEAACGEAIQRARVVQEKDEAEWSEHERRIVEAGNVARTKLILSNVRLVAKVAWDPRHRFRLDQDDLLQIGLLGLMRGVEGFDPAFGTRFSTYAFWWIRQSILRGIDDLSETVRLPVHVHERVRRYRRAKRLLDRKRGPTGVGAAVAESLGWSESYAAVIAGIAETQVVSLDERVYAEGEKKLGASIEGPVPSPEYLSETIELFERLRGLVDGLPDERMRDIVRKRFGLDGDRTLTLQELGDRHGVTRERIRQLESRALQLLRVRAVREELWVGGAAS